MKLSESLDAVDYTRPLNNPCGVALLVVRLVESEGADEAMEVNKRINDPARTATVLSDALKRHGYQLNPATIRRHRKGQCSCRSPKN